MGVVGIDSDKPGLLLTPEESRLLDALSDQAALAIDRVNLAQDIDRARLAAETDRLRAALLTSISHDLRTPLASILGSASSLVTHGQEFDATVQASLMRTILEEAERLNRFIGNLLDMTRLESGPLKPQTGPADLSDIIGATLQRADKILQNHSVEIDLESGLPLLDLDMVLMEQVLFNLFDNAAKYAPQGSRIKVTARHENKSIVIRVLDEGEGIPEADLERIFDKFYRVRRSDRQRAGTGLGSCDLPRFRRSHGRLDHGRQPDRPVRRGFHHQASRACHAEAPGRGPAVTPAAGPLRVLVVDDEPPILRFLRASLQSQGYIVSTAANARTALDMVRGHTADLVVLDLGLPDMDGLDVVRQIRDGGETLPIIILSSRDNESAKVKALDLGADDYVTKPFGIDELLARIRAAERHRLQQEGERPLFHAGDLSIDLVRRIVTVRGSEVKLSPREYDVLRLMVAHAGKVLTHRFMLEEIWGADADANVQYLRVYIRGLRQKIEADPERPTHILTETGVGYRLREPDQ